MPKNLVCSQCGVVEVDELACPHCNTQSLLPGENPGEKCMEAMLKSLYYEVHMKIEHAKKNNTNVDQHWLDQLNATETLLDCMSSDYTKIPIS